MDEKPQVFFHQAAFCSCQGGSFATSEVRRKCQSLKANTPADEPIIFLGAVYPTIATKEAYSWIKKCTRKPIKSTAYKARTNIIGGINLKTMHVEIADYKTVNCEYLINFFDVLKEKYPNSNKSHMILVNGPSNTSKNTRNEAEEAGKVTLSYIIYLLTVQI